MLFEIKLFVGMSQHPLVWRMGQRGPAEDPRRWLGRGWSISQQSFWSLRHKWAHIGQLQARRSAKPTADASIFS